MEQAECWLEIPGFESYEIDKNSLRVRSKKHDPPVILKQTRKTYTLYNGASYEFSPPRLLFSVFNNINPIDIDVRKFVISHVRGKLEVMDRASFNAKVKANQKQSYPNDILLEKYKEQHAMTEKLINYYKGKEPIDGILKQLYGYERACIAYIFARRFAHNEDNALELYKLSMDYLIDGIVNRKVIISHPLGYIKSTISRIVSKKRKITGFRKMILY